MIIQIVRISGASGLLYELLNHLWQSTLFAACAVVLAFAFRRTDARTRFHILMAASLKFLVPFSALEWVGRHLGWAPATSGAVGWSMVIDEVSRPFSPPGAVLGVGHTVSSAAGREDWLLWIWGAGAALVLAGWMLRWFRLRRALGSRDTVVSGPAFEIVCRSRTSVRLVSSKSAIEPGVFGIFRPLLVMPAAVIDRLSEAQLEAVIRHELCHIRRRDNLTAALHMIVETLFWFHPLVWWLGGRLIEERERACDEAVLDEFQQPQVYAQGILEVCRCCLESSLPCVAGVTGADLKRRIENIMSKSVGSRPAFGRRLLLWTAGAAAIAVPVGIGVLDAPPGHAQSTGTAAKEFEVASIKPMDPAVHGGRFMVQIQIAPGGRFIAKGLNLKMLIQQAYGVRDFQITGAPSWASTDRYEINAKGEGLRNNDDLKPALQALLADRFKLTLKHETRDMPVYALVVGKGGPKLKASEAGAGGRGDRLMMRRGSLEGHDAGMSALANALANQLGRAVIDKTGLTGRYDYTLEWTPDETEGGMMIRHANPDAPPSAPLDSSGPSIYTAIQEQLGLKLENSKGPVEILIVERAEKPSEN